MKNKKNKREWRDLRTQNINYINLEYSPSFREYSVKNVSVKISIVQKNS